MAGLEMGRRTPLNDSIGGKNSTRAPGEQAGRSFDCFVAHQPKGTALRAPRRSSIRRRNGSVTMPKREEKKGLGQRHLHLTAIGQSGNHPIGIAILRHRERQRKTLEDGLPLALTVGSQDRRIADAEAHME